MLAELTLPWVLGRAIDTILTPGPRTILAWVGIFLTAGCFRAISRFGQGVLQTRLAQAIVTDLRLAYQEKVLGLSFACHQELRRGELLARGTRDIQKTRNFYGDIFFQAVELLILLAGALSVMYQSAPAFAGIAGLMVLISGGTMALAAPGLRRRIRAEDDAYDHVTTTIQETVAGTRVVKAFRRESAEVARFSQHNQHYLTRVFRSFDFWALTMPTANILFSLSVPLTLLFGGWLVMHQGLALGQIAAALFYLQLIGGRLRTIGRIVMTSQTAAASAERLFEVLDRPQRIRLAQSPAPLPPGKGALRLERVSFAYPDETSVLQELNLEIRPGERLALVGPTGSGKSTLASLLARFHDPTSGRILLDGADIRTLDPQQLRREIGFVFQETFLFSASVAENIAFGLPDASDERIRQAAELAQATQFIEQLPEGYATMIGERGVTLSGGQKQRLAIARAILLDPRVLVLDDATASLDSRTEQTLHAAIRAATRDRTTIMIAQRMSTVRDADRIVVLDGQRILEQGSHQALLALGGWYAEIHQTQQHEAA